MSTSCTAFAYAIEPSERTFAATAAFTGAARFALMSDIAARSGSSSPASASSSSRVSWRYSSFSSVMRSALVVLDDRGRLLGVRVGDRVVRRDVQRQCGVDRRGHVRVDERHGGPLGQLLTGELVELLVGERPVLVHLLCH